MGLKPQDPESDLCARERVPQLLYGLYPSHYTEARLRNTKKNATSRLTAERGQRGSNYLIGKVRHMRKVVQTSKAPRPRGVYSQAVVADGFVFVAGQGPINPETNELELGDIRSETRCTLENIRAILEGSGSSLAEVVRVGVFLSDMNDFAAMNEVYREFFPLDPPARTTVGAQLLQIKIEIDCIARLRSLEVPRPRTATTRVIRRRPN